MNISKLLGIFILCSSFVFFPGNIFASGETITVGSDIVLSPYETIDVQGVQINGTGDPELTVHLFVTQGTISFTDTTNISFYNDTDSGNSIYATGLLSDLNNLLSNMQYTSDGLRDTTLEISLISEGQIYFPGNGHIYQIIQPETGITYNDAKIAANALSVDGASGYLGTITSQEENDFISERLSGDGWLGASDSDVEGDWKWIDGPELGTSFWGGLGLGQEPEGGPVGDEFSNWANLEPNDSGGEDCAQYYSDGGWNDLPCDYTLGSYLVEFGDDENLPTIQTEEMQINVEADTIQINSCEELMNLNNDILAYQHHTILLAKNIDCTGLTMTPLFDVEGGFRGVFDGQNHSIKGIEINESGQYNVGLFAYLDDDGIIKDLILESGTVSGGENVGGLVGTAYEGEIENVCSNVDVYATNGYAGGLVGYGSYLNITKSCSTGDVTSDFGDYVGGLIGYNSDELTISESYSSGDVYDVDEYVGGLVGYSNYVVEIENSYALGNLTANYECGGLMSYSENLTITSSYFAGLVSCNEESPYGILASNDSDDDIIDSFWDLLEGLNPIETIGTLIGATEGKTTSEMKDILTFTQDENLQESWDFDDIWNISSSQNNGYPFLRRVQSNVAEGEEVVQEDTSNNRRGRSGSSVRSRVNSLIKNGQTVKAEEIKNQFPNVFGISNSVSTGLDQGGTSEIQSVLIDLEFGMNNQFVNILQRFLISQNKGPAAIALANNGSTNYFGNLTKAALVEWQSVNGVVPNSGYFGPITRAKIKSLGL